MSFSVKDAKVAYYAKKYRTDELVQKVFTSYADNEMEDSQKKEKIGRYSAAVAISKYCLAIALRRGAINAKKN